MELIFDRTTRIKPAVISGLFLLVTSTAPVFAQTISSFSPQFGPPGTQVTLNGSGFSSVTRIQFGNVAADFTINSSIKITATVPALGETGRITAFGSLTRQSATDFTVAPRVDSFTPIFASTGQQITISGGNFISGQTTVRFGGVSATTVSVTAPTQIFATVPSSALSGPISISTFAGTNTTTSNLVVSGTAVSTGFNPPNGNFGDPIVISGATLPAQPQFVSMAATPHSP